MKKLVFPKIKIKVKARVLLWVVLLVAILMEGGVLYKYLYLAPRQSPPLSGPAASEAVQVNFPLYQKVAKWLDDNAAYPGPVYKLEGATTGRDNPFAEYR